MAKKLAFDKGLFTVVMLLLGLGLVMVYSASAVIARERGSVNSFLVKQAAAALLGLTAMWGLMHLDYRWLRRPAIAWGILGGSLLLLVAVLFSPALNHTNRWLFVGGVSLQPSELAKLALVVFLAYQMDRKPEGIGRVELLLPAGLAIALCLGLVLEQPNLSTAILIAGVGGIMLFLGGLAWRWLGLALTVVAPAVWLLILQVPYRRERLLAFLHPEADPLGAGFQASQSLIAVGSGGLFGRGLGNSVQKLHFLPYPHSDYVFSIVAEELGFLGAMAVVGLFTALLWRGVRAGWRAPDHLGRHLAWGFTALVVLQALLHMSVTVALFPSTGIPLPLIAYGGSSMVSSLAACGLILNVSQHG